MDMHTACEEAYKNGYAKGKSEMQDTLAIERERADGLQKEAFRLHIKLDALQATVVEQKDKIRRQERMLDTLRGREEAFARLLGIVYEAIGTEGRQRLYKLLFPEEKREDGANGEPAGV